MYELVLGLVVAGLVAMAMALAVSIAMMPVAMVMMNALHRLQLAVRLLFTGNKSKRGDCEHKQTEAFHRPRDLSGANAVSASLKREHLRKSLHPPRFPA